MQPGALSCGAGAGEYKRCRPAVQRRRLRHPLERPRPRGPL